MGRVDRSPDSIQDLFDIALYISRDSRDAAKRLLRDIDDALEKLADFPGMGAVRDELQPGLRSYPVGKYLLFYHEIEGGIELARVIHGMRLLEAQFPPNPPDAP